MTTIAPPPARDTTWPQVPLDGVLELRVHGVGGASAADMLDQPHPVQVSGDGIAGCLRGDDLAAGGAGSAHAWHLEAYSWGALTGRAASRALWLLLLPFSLANLAGWMGLDRRRGPTQALASLAGLCLTLLYVLLAAQVALDSVALQCAAAPRCAVAGWPVLGDPALADDPARRVALAAAAPLLLVVGLWALARRTRDRYERWGAPAERRAPAPREALARPAESAGDGSTVLDPVVTGLASPGFWTGQAYAERLARLHVGAGVSAIALLVSAT